MEEVFERKRAKYEGLVDECKGGWFQECRKVCLKGIEVSRPGVGNSRPRVPVSCRF